MNIGYVKFLFSHLDPHRARNEVRKIEYHKPEKIIKILNISKTVRLKIAVRLNQVNSSDVPNIVGS